MPFCSCARARGAGAGGFHPAVEAVLVSEGEPYPGHCLRLIVGGTKWYDGQDFSRAQKTARKLKKEFGLLERGLHLGSQPVIQTYE